MENKNNTQQTALSSQVKESMNQQLIGRPQRTRLVGRPTVITENIVRKLLAGFQRGYNDTKACRYAKISRDTFYRGMKENQEFSDRIADAKNYWVLLSGEHITGLLLDKSNKNVRLKIETAKWVYEKHTPDVYSNKAQAILQQNNQNNNFYLSDEEYNTLIKQSGLEESDPETLLDALEEASEKHEANLLSNS